MAHALALSGSPYGGSSLAERIRRQGIYDRNEYGVIGTPIQQVFDRLGIPVVRHRTSSESIANVGVHAFRQATESSGVAVLAGFLHAKLGLDVNIKGWKLPADALLAIAAYAMAIKDAHSETATDARNIAAALTTIFFFRQSDAFFRDKLVAQGMAVKTTKPLTKGLKVAGEGGDFGDEMGSDPILNLAQTL